MDAMTRGRAWRVMGGIVWGGLWVVATASPGWAAPQNVVDPEEETAYVQLLDHTVVNGSIKVAPGTDPNEAVYFSSTVTPTDVDSLPRKFTLPTQIVAPADAEDLGAIDLKGQVLSLETGVYKAASLSLANNSTGQQAILYTTGPVSLYVEGSVLQKGGLLYGQNYNSPANQFSPANFQLFVVNTGNAQQAVQFEAGLTAAVVFADHLPITLSKKHILIGSAIGQSMEVEDSSIYYPQTLSNVRFAVNSSSPVADLLWMRIQSVPLSGSTSQFLTGEVRWTPGETPEQQANFWVWEPENGGWWSYPGKPAGNPPGDSEPSEGDPNKGGDDGEVNCGCFLAGTPILLADGRSMPIEQLTVGELVMAYDETAHDLKPDAVKETFIHVVDGYLIVNGHLRVTPNHPVYADGRWVEIGLLRVGDQLVNADGRREPITSIERILEPVTVYNIEVNPYHTYVAGGIIAHNKVFIPCE